MKIVYLAAGAADMYCGSCLHDNRLAAALIAAGEDVLLVPLYTPLRTDEENVSTQQLFFGGVNVALQQKSSLFQHTPWWFDRILDRPGLLSRLGQLGTRPEHLGNLTVSMLQGERGRQRKELKKLIDWLLTCARPQLIHLSNSLLSGLARRLRDQIGVPVVCTLSGEDLFLEKLAPPYKEQAISLLRERCQDIDAFVALNHYYADFMSEYLAVERRRIHVIRPGLHLDGYGTRNARCQPTDPVTIGYLARICPEKGPHLLAEAFALLRQESDMPQQKLTFAGTLGRQDRSYWKTIERRLQSEGLAGCYEYVGELTRDEKISYLQTLDLFCLPTTYCESKGIPALEALAHGVPVILPSHGSFPEIIQLTDGGILCKPDDPRSLADAILQFVRDPQRARQHGWLGQKAVHKHFHEARMAQKTRQLYASLTGQVLPAIKPTSTS